MDARATGVWPLRLEHRPQVNQRLVLKCLTGLKLRVRIALSVDSCKRISNQGSRKAELFKN